ncbi:MULTISPECIES: DUF3817 domain-containing protein [Mycobacteriaceae]|jgi:integral membrane protein|uniref:DUF3817 domain-containing protein n=1 Tax=Mycobacteriaceae TaxID=1762 RepID=UPI0008007EB9|nr:MULTISPECIES: DUF3817 domain-containing protein [Mycobacteriaceae]MCK0176482.1 DUF3817 domain-containing protein [Mycolicibacterium sp. F2034L]OBB56692.1 hypothetical protein A5757_22415 [Mycobacterium sp. 852013-51886_SCH5428379]
MTASPTPAGVSIETVRKAVRNYRVLAWATGIWLIVLCAEMVLKYIVKVDWPFLWIVAPIHGWVYFAYLLVTANLAVKVRWPIGKTIGILLAGTVPLLGIIVEQRQSREFKERFGI